MTERAGGRGQEGGGNARRTFGRQHWGLANVNPGVLFLLDALVLVFHAWPNRINDAEDLWDFVVL
jgi:hypothetical protein